MQNVTKVKVVFGGIVAGWMAIELFFWHRQHTFLYKKFVYGDELINNLKKEKVYNELLGNSNPSRFKKFRNAYNKRIYGIKICYFPLVLRSLGSVLNSSTVFCLKTKYRVRKVNYKGVFFYIISPSYTKRGSQHMVFFNGFCGFLYPIMNLITVFIDKGIIVHIPVYGPSDASLDYSFIFESTYYQVVYDYLVSNNIFDVMLGGWSLGGILYKGFEEYSQMRRHMININAAYLFEPLLCSNGINDCQMMQYSESLKLFDDVISSTERKRYYFLNRLFCTVIYSTIGFATYRSLVAYNSAETIASKNDYPYCRFLFVSENDLILNPKRDRIFIQSNFLPENVFYRKGYHGGWAKSKNLFLARKNVGNVKCPKSF